MSYLQPSKFVLIPFILVSLISCGKTLDAAKVQETIKSSLTKQGGTSIKSVICPENIQPEAGRSFECTGVLDSGAGFTIAVQQQDNQGNIVWEASSVKGLLNMAQLQTEFEQGLKKEVGQASINCGSANSYRSVKPGEIFECQIIKRNKDAVNSISEPESKPENVSSSAKSTQPKEMIQVTIQPSGDINWQRILKEGATVADSKLPAQKDIAPPETPKPETPNSDQAPNTSTPPAAKSPEEFLNQPGAADNFN